MERAEAWRYVTDALETLTRPGNDDSIDRSAVPVARLWRSIAFSIVTCKGRKLTLGMFNVQRRSSSWPVPVDSINEGSQNNLKENEDCKRKKLKIMC